MEFGKRLKKDKKVEKVPFWRTVMPEIGKAELLGFEDAPCDLFLNLKTVSPGDKLEVAVTLHGNGLPGTLWDTFSIEKSTESEPVGVVTYLTVNRTLYSRGEILQIKVPEGPWKARFMYKQIQGTNKKVGFLVKSA